MFEIHPDTRLRAVKQVADYTDAMLEAPTAFRGLQVRGGGAVAEFERLLARRCGFPHCLATASATSGMLAVVAAADLRGRRVLVPDRIWSGTPGALRFAGVNVAMVPTSENGTLDPSALARFIADGDTAAVVVSDYENSRHAAAEIQVLCESSGSLYIEDSSWLPGIFAPSASLSVADIQVMSFGPGKPLSLGEGGAVLFRDTELYRRAVAVSQHPERCASEDIGYSLDELALNARIHPVAAILGSALLEQGTIKQNAKDL